MLEPISDIVGVEVAAVHLLATVLPQMLTDPYERLLVAPGAVGVLVRILGHRAGELPLSPTRPPLEVFV